MLRLSAVEFSRSEINRLKITDGRSVALNAIRPDAWSPRGSGS
jgi:hypothetical protein